ncbi:MAG: hypothetical protein P8N31_06195 [Planctomycetota bacterium]|nr:hypothetical protein [Planctomycetota bacterium]MDG2143124.1 hypothetical protein [Planctomycetota bacterium]
MLRKEHNTEQRAPAPCPSPHTGGKPASNQLELKKRLRALHEEHGHGHPKSLKVELELARLLYSQGMLDESRKAFAEVLAYQSLIDGDHGTATAQVAVDVFRLLCDQDDRSAMAGVYYRYLSWIPMRDPATLSPELRSVLLEVENLLTRST